MPQRINVNVVSHQPTHFLKGVELIEQARTTFQVPSENWPSPTRHRFGIPGDMYYAEIWVDGMDWQNSYWILESFKYNDPVCLPFIIFEDSQIQDRFNDYDYSILIKAALYERRDRLWIKKDDGIFNDTTWSYFHMIDPIQTLKETPGMFLFQVEHGSQRRVQFYMNLDFVPERKRSLDNPIGFSSVDYPINSEKE